MAQTVTLAVGTATADGADVIISQGGRTTIGIYAGAGTKLDSMALAYLYQRTPGAENLICELTSSQASLLIEGPNTVFVRRVVAGVPFGAFAE